MHKELLTNVSFGELQNFESIAALPLFTPVAPDAFLYITLAEALEKSLLTIMEVSEGGSVPELRVKSAAPLPVLLLAGEEIKGAKQNRILSTSILVAAGAEQSIPVACTERGRWSYNSPGFKDSDNISSSDVRQAASFSVSDNLVNLGAHHVNQVQVWDKIEELHEKSKTHHTSKTRAMDDAFQARKHDLDEAVRRFSLFPGQTGILFFHDGKVAGLDLISRPGAYARLHEKLVRSYVIDGLDRKAGKEHDAEALQYRAKDFLQNAVNASATSFKSPGLGDDIRLGSPVLKGSMLVHDAHAIHACIFRVEPQESHMAGYSRRSKL